MVVAPLKQMEREYMGAICIKLDAKTWQTARAQIMLIEDAERQLFNRRMELDAFINQAIGVNVSDGEWTFDIEHGLLEKPEPPTTEPDEITPRRKKRSA